MEGPLRRHPTRSTLERFLLGTLAEAERRAVVRHLLPGCASCRQAMAAVAATVLPRYLKKGCLPRAKGAADFSTHIYDRAFARAEAAARRWRSALEEERREARGKIPVILAQQTEDGGLPRHHGPEFWTLGLVEELLACSCALRHENVAATLQYAQLARLAAENLATGKYGAEQVADTQARAWAELGNAYRIADDLKHADQAFDRAKTLSAAGTGDPLLAASIADLTASLRCHQRRFTEAFRLLDVAYDLFVDHGDRHRGGRTLISKGIYTGYAGEPAEALELLSRGLLMLDRRREPALLAQTLHAFLWFKVDLGEYHFARVLVRDLRWLYKRHGGEMDFLKLRWLEGRIAAGLGDLSRAEQAFAAVRAGMVKDGLAYHSALAGLDLAAVWFRQGKIGQIPPLVDEMLAAFRARGIAREALAALLLLSDANRHRTLSLDLIQRVAQILAQIERFGMHGPEEPVER
jgi:tetratricopeptide (TPR) repeat protein